MKEQMIYRIALKGRHFPALGVSPGDKVHTLCMSSPERAKLYKKLDIFNAMSPLQGYKSKEIPLSPGLAPWAGEYHRVAAKK